MQTVTDDVDDKTAASDHKGNESSCDLMGGNETMADEREGKKGGAVHTGGK